MQQGASEPHGCAGVWNRVAREENEGNMDLIDKTLRAKAPDALKADYDRAAGPALDALRGFTKFLKDDLSKKTSDWRLGKENYDQKFAYTLVSGKKPEQVLAEAEAALKDVRDQMAKLAAPRLVKRRARQNRASSTPRPPPTWIRPRRIWRKPPISCARNTW